MKKIKLILCIVLTILVICISIFPVYAARYYTNGNFRFEVNRDLLVLEMVYSGISGDVVIPSDPIGILGEAFLHCNYMTSVVIPDSVKWIDSHAFSDCANLKSVTFGSNVTGIAKDMFINCPITDVYYKGTIADKNKITNNECLMNATWHFVICENEGHTYDDVCDSQCNVCGEERAAHIYDNLCDDQCNECGTIREIEHSYGDGKVCNICGYKNYTPGDINDSGAQPDLDDVVVLAQVVAGWQNVTHNEAALDVNGDSDVTLDDVVLLAQFVAGWAVTIK